MRDDYSVRITLDIDEDVLEGAKELAARRGTTAWRVLSEQARSAPASWLDMAALRADHKNEELDMEVSLDEDQKKALGIVLEKGVVGGEELKAKSRINNDELFRAMKVLIRMGLVNSNTVLYSADVLTSAYFNLKPSALSLAKDLVSS